MQPHARRFSTPLIYLGALFFLLSTGLPRLLPADEANSAVESSNAKGWIERERVLAAAAKATAERFPNADEVLVAKHVKISYNPDGTYTQWHEEYVKVLTEKGRRGYQTLSSQFTIPYQQEKDCTIPLVEIIKADGKRVPIDVPQQSKLMTDPDGMDENIYNPNEKILRVNIAGLEIGDLLHYVMFDRIVQARMKDTWCDFTTFEEQRPILEETFEVSAPKEKPLASIALLAAIKDSVTHSKEEKDGRIHYRWVAREIPPLFPEPSMPPEYTVAQRLLLSTVPDWKTVSRWYWNLSQPHLKTSPEIVEKVNELTKDIQARRARIEALFTFVSQKIRYLGITVEATAPGYEPHDVKDTFAQRHGVCRDKAALLVAMLQHAGFEAFPTLIHNGPKKDPEVPQPYFNHAITAVRNEDGSYLLMDSTDETTQQMFPSYLDNKSFLVATPEGEDLRTSPIVPAEENLMHIDTTARVSAAGDLTATSTLRFDGINDNAYRGFLARLKPEQQRRYFEGVVDTIASGAELTAFELQPAEMTDTREPLMVKMEYAAKQALVDGQTLALLPLPLAGARVGMANFLIGRTGLKERKYPFVTEIACGVHERLTLNLDPDLGRLINVPEFEQVDTPSVSWKIKTARGKKGFSIEGGMTLKVVEFTPAQYGELKDALKKIERDLRKMAMLDRKEKDTERATTTSDLLILEDRTDVVLKDAHSWTTRCSVRKQVLTYAGKKQAGEIKLDYNTGWQQVSFESGLVTTADGKSHEISAKEINLMDEEWVGIAKRYPPGKTLIASLPSVDLGSTISYQYTETHVERPFFATRIVFSDTDPVKSRRFSLTLPPGFDAALLRFEIFNGTKVKHTKTQTAVGTTHTWEALDLPAVKREDARPPAWAYLPTLFISAGDWALYASAVNEKLRAAAAQDAGVAEAVKAILKEARTPQEKLRALRDHVAKHVRDVGPGLNAMPMSAISNASTVLSDSYGNGPDRAVLLRAMLTAAGFNAKFVLPAPETRHPRLRQPLIDYPSMLFSSVLVEVRVADRTYYLNDTNQYQDLDVSAHENALTLDLSTGKVRAALCENTTRYEIDYRIDLKAEGAARLEQTMRHRGAAAGRRRQFFAELTPEHRRRYHLELIAGIAQAAEADGDLETKMGPGVTEERLAVNVPGYAVRDGDYLYFQLPASMGALVYSRGEERSYPYYENGTDPSIQRVVVDLPEGFEPALLPFAMRDAAPLTGEASLDVQREGRKLTVTYRTKLEPSLVTPDQYAALLQLQHKLRHPNTRTLVLKRQTP